MFVVEYQQNTQRSAAPPPHATSLLVDDPAVTIETDKHNNWISIPL